jgi:hypothetical protein
VYISAGVPRIKMADMNETRIDIAIGTSKTLLKLIKQKQTKPTKTTIAKKQ